MSSEIVLVNITGVDKPGLLAMVTSCSADFQATVLDVGQAIIHDTLALGLLLQVPAARKAALIERLRAELAAQQVPVQFSDIESGRYEDWVAAQGAPSYVLTLMTEAVSAQVLAQVSGITRDYGLNIQTIRRLTGRLPLAALPTAGTRISIELLLRGRLERDQEAQLKGALLAAGTAHDFDFSVQRDTVYRRNRRLVAFDMDSTLIHGEVIDELAARHGVGDEVAAITARAMRGELDFKESFQARAALLKGLPESALADVAAAVRLSDGAERLIRVLKHFGYKVAVLSGGFAYVGARLQAQLGLDYVFANTLAIEDGVMTGAAVGEIVDAQRKAALLREIAEREGIDMEQTIAIGDGANDLPMLSAAGLGIAYHAKPLVKESAEHAISTMALDSLLYLMGFTDSDIEQALARSAPHA
ncbi:MAG: phosphoserine phosphatase SerB [Pseudomonadota bacterium]